MTRIRDENAIPGNLDFSMDDIFAIFPRLDLATNSALKTALAKPMNLRGIFDHEVRHDDLVFYFCIHNLRVADPRKPICWRCARWHIYHPWYDESNHAQPCGREAVPRPNYH